MARIVGVDLPSNKRGEIALTYIFGIGRSSARTILEKAGIDFDTKVKDWNDDQLAAVRNVINGGYKVEGELRTRLSADSYLRPKLKFHESVRANTLELSLMYIQFLEGANGLKFSLPIL